MRREILQDSRASNSARLVHSMFSCAREAQPRIAFGASRRCGNGTAGSVGAKLKGDATVRLASGSLRWAEIHWYEAHGVGKRGLKIKRFLD
jgi:hypothetical protein